MPPTVKRSHARDRKGDAPAAPAEATPSEPTLIEPQEVAAEPSPFEDVDEFDFVRAAEPAAPAKSEAEIAPVELPIVPYLRGWRAVLARVRRTVIDQPEEPSFAPEDITPVPPVGKNETVVEMRPIRPPYAFVRVVFNSETSEHRYEVIEPPLSPVELTAYGFIKEAFVRTLDIDLDTLDRAGAQAYITAHMAAIIGRHHLALTPLSRARIAYYLQRDFLGFAVIDTMMADATIEDISCDGPDIPVFVYHRRYESLRSNVMFRSDELLDGFVMSLVQRSGKHISVAEPLVDATLNDGSRLQASLSREITTRGSTFTIRRFRKDPMTPTDLVLFETVSPEMMGYLWLAVEHGASAIICGGTASGKTTTLNALSIFIPRAKKIVSIEDTREINLTHENWIPGVTRTGAAADTSGRRVGGVDMFDLLKSALRQRPEYVILGEVRGVEAYVLFQAMATGHTVYSTMHADSVSSAVHRLENKPIDVPRNLLAGLDIVVVLGETRVDHRRVRKVRDLVEITGVDPRSGDLLTNMVFNWDAVNEKFRFSPSSAVLRRIAERRQWTDEELHAELDRRARVIELLVANNIRDIGPVSATVAAYAIDPARTLKELEARRPEL